MHMLMGCTEMKSTHGICITTTRYGNEGHTHPKYASKQSGRSTPKLTALPTRRAAGLTPAPDRRRRCGVQRGGGEWALGAAPAVRLHTRLRMDPSDTQPLQRVLVEKSDAEPLRPPGFIKLGAPLPIRIPTRPEEITIEWLTDAFRFKGYLMRDGRVVSLNMQAIGEGQGAFGDLVLVTVSFELTLTLTLTLTVTLTLALTLTRSPSREAG